MFKTFAFLIAVLILNFSSGAAFAKGSNGGGIHKDYRNPALWNGDAYVSDADKMQMYSNYYATQNAPAEDRGNYGTWHNSVPGQIYSGPAFIGPDHYDSVVQTYNWPSH